MTNKLVTKSIPKIEFEIPKTILYTGKTLQAISPYLAMHYAVKLFKTPIKHKIPEREIAMQKSAQLEKMMIPEINKEIMVYKYGYSKKIVLLVHGWSGRGTQLYKIADKLLENGFMTISFDAPAHGLSSGKTTLMNEFVIAVKHLHQKFGPFHAAIGHSLGGMTILNAFKQNINLKCLVTIGSGDLISDICDDFVEKIDLKPIVSKKMKAYFDKNIHEDLDNYSGSNAAKENNIPTLVIHDTDDKDVPVSCAHNIRQNLKYGELLITNGLGHRQILKDNLVISRIIDFIKRTS